MERLRTGAHIDRGASHTSPPHGPVTRASVRRVLGIVPTVTALAAIVVVGFAVSAYDASRQAQHATTQHLVPATDATDRLVLALLDQEAGQRGFVITADESFLVPFDEGRATELVQLERLEQALLPDYADLYALVEPLRVSAERWRTVAATPEIEAVRDGRRDDAAALVAAGQGAAVFDEIRVQFNALRSAIEVARASTRNELGGRVDRLFVVALLAAIGAVVAAAMMWFVARQRVAAPLERLATEAATVASGRLDAHITAGGAAEIDEVARSVEQMRVQLLREVSRAFSSGMVEAEEAERARLAGELHDDPIQVLTSAQWQLEALALGLSDGDRDAATSIAGSLADVQARLRTLMFRLHPPGLDDEGLAIALDDLLLDTFDGTDVDVRLAVDVPAAPGAASSALVFRIAAEAIRNVRKHADARSIEVSVRSTGDGIELAVVDDGVGDSSGSSTDEAMGAVTDGAADAARRALGVGGHHHHGIEISRGLAAAAGGWWQQSSRPGAGTAVRCWLPATFGEVTFDEDSFVDREPDAETGTRASASTTDGRDAASGAGSAIVERR